MFSFLGSHAFHMSCSSDGWFICLFPLSLYCRKIYQYKTLLPLSSDAWYIITSISYAEHTLRRSWFTIRVPLTLKISYYSSSWHGRVRGGHLWNKLMKPCHAVPLGKDAHRTSIIHCINSGWKLPSITSLLTSVSLCISHWFNLFWWSLFYCTQFSITGKFWLHYPQFWCFKTVG